LTRPLAGMRDSDFIQVLSRSDSCTQDGSKSIFVTLDLPDFQVVMRECDAPGHRTSISSLGLDVPLENGVPSIDHQGASFQERSEYPEHSHDRDDFLFRDMIPKLGVIQDAPRETDRLNATIMLLSKDSASCPLVGMWGDPERLRSVRMAQQGGSKQSSFSGWQKTP